MKKNILVILSLLLCCLHAMAQGSMVADESQKRLMLGEIARVANSIQSLQCDFTQVKQVKFLNDKLTSKGVMSFMSPDKLRWEYVTPYQYVFIVNGNTVTVKSMGKTNALDISKSRSIQNLIQLMVNSVSGKGLENNSDYDIAIYADSHYWNVVLTPRKTDAKRLFKKVSLHFDIKNKVITRVEMEESNNDHTVISMENVRQNEIKDEKIFVAH